ncbi:sugar phosphate isomerase/epimerase [bacterium]|nr:sugar phosphate isomerase/epimerase [bacterium]
MILSISSYTWLPGSFLSELDTLQSHGIDAVEIFCTPRHLDINDPEKVQQAGMALREQGFRHISMHAPSAIGDLSAPDETEREETVLACQRALDAAMLMGANLITLHPSSIEGDRSESEDRWPSLIETLREISGYAEDRDIKVAIENFPEPFFGCDPIEMYDKLAGLEIPNVGMCLDVGHAFVGGHLTNALDHFGEKIFSVHASDNRGTVDEHLPPGQGNVPWDRVFQGMQNYDGPLVVEVRDGRKFSTTLADVIDFAEETGLFSFGQLSH